MPNFIIERKVRDSWEMVHDLKRRPYMFNTRLEAETMARVLYRRIPDTVRITEYAGQSTSVDILSTGV